MVQSYDFVLHKFKNLCHRRKNWRYQDILTILPVKIPLMPQKYGMIKYEGKYKYVYKMLGRKDSKILLGDYLWMVKL